MNCACKNINLCQVVYLPLQKYQLCCTRCSVQFLLRFCHVWQIDSLASAISEKMHLQSCKINRKSLKKDI